MSFPTMIKAGFDFDEAIALAELSRLAEQLFEPGDEPDLSKVYAGLSRGEWRFVWASQPGQNDSGCLILRHQEHNQFAVIFCGSVLTGRGVELANLSYGGDNVMVPYPPLPGEKIPPDTECRVHQGVWQTYRTFQADLEFFFEIVTTVPQPDERFAVWAAQPESAQAIRLDLLGAAVRERFGAAAESRVRRGISTALRRITQGERTAADFSFAQLISRGTRMEQAMELLVQMDGDEDDAESTPPPQPRVDVYTAGHGIGGGLAAHCALHLQRFRESHPNLTAVRVKMVGLGMPKPGNGAFARYFQQRLPALGYRVENRLDPAIRQPMESAPFPHNLKLLIPGVDHVQQGDSYYTAYEPTGEAYTMMHFGYHDLGLKITGPLKVTLPIPFPHGAETYRDMLIADRDRQERLWQRAQNFMDREYSLIDLPATIRPGFDFDEAIAMAELARRAYKLLDADDGRPLQDFYNTFSRDEWLFVHGIQPAHCPGRCLIFRHRTQNHYVLVFSTTAMADSGEVLANISYGGDNVMTIYPPIPGEKLPPPRDCRVHLGFFQTYCGLQDDVALFFQVLVSAQLADDQFEQITHLAPEIQGSRLAAIGAAVRERYGAGTERRVLRVMQRAIRQVAQGKHTVEKFSLNSLIQEGARLEQTLELLTQIEEEQAPTRAQHLSVYITGHGSGAILASFATLHLQRSWESDPGFPVFRLKVYGIGGPKIGNKSFAKYYNRRLPTLSFRIENLLDPSTRKPVESAPFPYSLQLRLPGIDYVRKGDLYYANYEHVGEPFSMSNLGQQKVELNALGPLRLTLPLPFPHGADIYREMLITARDKETKQWQPAQSYMKSTLQEQTAELIALQTRMEQIGAAVHSLQKSEQAEKRPQIADLDLATSPEVDVAALQQQIRDLQEAVQQLTTQGDRA